MDMIHRDLSRYYLKLVLKGDLTKDIARTYRHFSREHFFPIFRNPDHVNFQIRFGMGAKPITSHSDRTNLFFA